MDLLTMATKSARYVRTSWKNTVVILTFVTKS